jgi:Cof subfamily protein (haloacid dehalogenase superfamily)
MNSKIQLLLSDIDGTLVPHDKTLTPATLKAVSDLRDAGILFAITSSRPPRGLSMYLEPLALTTPISAFNGGMIVDPQQHVLEERTIDDDVVPVIIDILDDLHVPVWVYRAQEWYVRDAGSAHVQHEAAVCQFQPLTVANFDAVGDGVAKIVGATDDSDALTKARVAIQGKVGEQVSATNSQTYYLDVTNPQANKGAVVDFLASTLHIDRDSIATIGDAHNDVSMFERSGLSIAMGNADDDVKASASRVTSSNEDDGFAHAVKKFILSR